MFITIEDETVVSKLVIWPSLFEKQRRIILTASMLGVRGRVQREGEVVHVVVEHLIDMSSALASVGGHDGAFPLPHGRGVEFHHASVPDARDRPSQGMWKRDIYVPNLHIYTIQVKTRNFR